jgi:hypothetical protein
MADLLVPYLEFNPTIDDVKPKPLKPLPFPGFHIPSVFNLKYFFIEKVELGYFLRSSLNPLFCCALFEVEKDIEVELWDQEKECFKYDVDGNPLTKIETLSMLCFSVESELQVVAFFFEGKGESFLNSYTSNLPVEQLDERLKMLYEAALLSTDRMLGEITLGLRQDDLGFRGLEPRGEWEAQIFRDVFQSNPSLMSDDEFEMIFGVER